MREILFRGKRKDNNAWTEGYLFKTWNRTYLLWGMTGDVPNMVEVIPETVGQFTGLVDNSSEKIFEGDIIRFEGDKIAYRVGFVNGCFSPFDCLSSYRLEVIGNIYDNPELREAYND